MTSGTPSVETEASTTTQSATTDTTEPIGPPLLQPTAEAPTAIDVLYTLHVLKVTPDTGGTLALDGMVISVPPGAVAAATDVQVKRLTRSFHVERRSDLPTGDAVLSVGPTYDFGPDGLVFDRPVTITLTYDDGAIPPGWSEDNVCLAYWNGQDWVVHAGLLDSVNKTVTVQLERFNGLALTTVVLALALVEVNYQVWKIVINKLRDPERINTDAVLKGTASQWITPNNPTVAEYAKSAVIRVPTSESVVPLNDPVAFGRLLETSQERPYISFLGKGKDGGDSSLIGRYSKEEGTNWQMPADYITKSNLVGDCSDASNALASILISRGYKAKVVFGYAGDKESPHVWVETLVDGKPYYVDENGQFAPLTPEELGKAKLIRPDPGDPRGFMWDDKGQQPYDPEWWKKAAFSGTYEGTLLVPDPGNVPLKFTVADDGSLEGILDYVGIGKGPDGKPVPMTMKGSFTGTVSADGHLTATGALDATVKGKTRPEWTGMSLGISGQITAGGFQGDFSMSSEKVAPVTATRK